MISPHCSLGEILTPEVCRAPMDMYVHSLDIAALRNIADSRIEVRYFEFEGRRYQGEQAKEYAQNLEKELFVIEEQLTTTDRTLFSFFKGKARSLGKEEEFLAEAGAYLKSQTRCDQVYQSIRELSECARKLSNELLKKELDFKQAVAAFMGEAPRQIIKESTWMALENYLNAPGRNGACRTEEEEDSFGCTNCSASIPPGVLMCSRCGTSRIDLTRLGEIVQCVDEARRLTLRCSLRRFLEYEAGLLAAMPS